MLSNHHPLLIDRSPPIPRDFVKLFRFEMWTMHRDFGEFVNTNWQGDLPPNSNFAQFTAKLKEWNVTVFGNLFWAKQRILSLLDGIQSTYDYHLNPFLISL